MQIRQLVAPQGGRARKVRTFAKPPRRLAIKISKLAPTASPAEPTRCDALFWAWAEPAMGPHQSSPGAADAVPSERTPGSAAPGGDSVFWAWANS